MPSLLGLLVTNCVCVVGDSMECNEAERLAAEKRDAVKTTVREINEQLSEITDKKKEKMKDAKKTRKYVSLFVSVSTENYSEFSRCPLISQQNMFFW